MISEKLAKSMYSQWEYHMKSAAINGFGEKVICDKTEKHSKKNDPVELIELRKNPRKIASKPLYFAIQNKYYKGIIKNLSRSGAFIETKAKFSKRIKIKLVVPGANKYILIKCKIIHFNQTGFGVKFKNILKIKKFSGTKKYGTQISILKKV